MRSLFLFPLSFLFVGCVGVSTYVSDKKIVPFNPILCSTCTKQKSLCMIEF